MITTFPAASPLAAIERKVASGERLSFADGMTIATCTDLVALGRLADRARRLRLADEATGDEVYFINNRHINYTNVCKNRCRLCAFSRDEGQEGAFTLTLDEILQRARASLADNITELHIVGGEHPTLTYEQIRTIIAELHALAPQVHLKAFTASEIVHFANTTGMSEEEVLVDLREAGLGSLPGGGAEILSSRVRSLICDKKISGEEWLEVHKLAHRLGFRTNATMLYGQVETLEERVDHLVRLREAQDETGGFQAFTPLSFQAANTAFPDLPPTTGLDDLRTLALARLMLDNFPHMKAYWVMIGLKIAQLSLWFGTSDLDGTVVDEKIANMAGSDAGFAVPRGELIRLIKDAGRVPVERDTLYRAIRRYDD